MHRRGPIGPVHLHGQLQRLNRNRAIDRSKLWPVAPLGQRKQVYCNWAGHILPGQLTHQLAWWNTDETEARMAGWLPPQVPGIEKNVAGCRARALLERQVFDSKPDFFAGLQSRPADE